MSRHIVRVTNGPETDLEATIGYDPQMQTFCLQAFPDAETDEYALCLGTCFEEFPTLESIIAKARSVGFDIGELSHDTSMAMLKEAGPLYPPNLAERLGL